MAATSNWLDVGASSSATVAGSPVYGHSYRALCRIDGQI
jgi:hypothetical protein